MARSFILTPSASTSKRYSRNWDSRKATICTPSDTFFVSTLLHEGVDKNTVADLAGHGDTSFLERTYCHPQMQLKQEAAKRMSNSLFATPNLELLVS